MKSVKVSQRLQDQIPAFIKEEDQSFVDLLVQYYKSQEKSGKPYDILNNILSYTDISSDEYDPNFISSSSIVLNRIGATDQNITVETVDNFLEKDGTIKIDNEIIFYEETSKSPEVVFTPGVNKLEFDKKIQELENIRPQFDGTQTSFQLKLLGTPITPSSVEYLRVIVNGFQLEPNVDYFLDGSSIRFQTPPQNLAGSTTVTKIEYLIGYTSVPVRVLDVINITNDLIGATILPLRLNTVVYTPLSTVSCLVAVNGVVQEPFTDYTVYNDHLILKKAVSLNDKITVRSVELIAPQFGKGASAIARVSDNKVTDLIVKNGGQDYRINFTPKVTILTPEGVTGKEATAEALVNGIKNVQLIDGGQGYTSANPPVVVFDTPADPSGSIAKATVTVDDASGQVTGINVQSSGSGYDTIPSISFTNAAGATISDAEIDSEGKVVDGSIKVLTKGLHYTTAPEVYIDAPVDPIGIRASAIAVLDDQSRVDRIEMISPGRGYVTAPRCRIIDPIGAQILDVKVSGGKLTDIQLLTGGSGYNDAPSVYIVDNRKNLSGEAIGGTGATAVATIFNGEITDINITSFGDGYSDTEPPQVFIASPKAAAASCDVGFQEITGFTVHSHGSEYQPSQFKNCKRGVSGVSSYDIRGNQVFTNEAQSIQSSHEVGTSIENLDSLFAKTLYERFVNQFLPDAEIDYTTINAPQIIKTIQDFYVSKGTKTATEYLFKILFSENVDVSYPKDELIKPSAATWSVDTIIRVELISGSPVDILDSQLFQFADAVDTTVGNAVCLVENVIAINTGDRTIYELSISEETLEGKFSIPYKTTLVEPLSTTESIITVDSTIGWPERNGIIIMGDSERIQYKEKSLNQFIECTRSKNGVVEDWDSGTPIYSDIFCYINRGQDTEVKLRVLGIAEATGTVLTDTGSYYLPSDKLNVASLGSSSTDQRVTSWLYNVKKLISVNNIEPGGLNNQTATVYTTNNHGLLVGDSVTIYGANPTVFNGTFAVTSRISATVFSYQISAPAPNAPQGNILMSVDLNKGKSDEESINNSIAQFTTNVQNTFFNANYSYIATTGIPNYKVGPFIGSALLPGNQRKLSRFPRIVDTVSRRDDLSFGPIGCWVNGVAVWSYKSQIKTKFGGITSFDIVDAGQGYDAASKPLIEITGGGGTGAAASVIVNGSLFNVDVTAGGSGYTSSPLVSIVGGGGFGATATAVITNGVVSKVLVETPGQGYTSAPTVSISGGNGTGATANAEVRGPIQSISVDTSGSSYTTAPTIKLNSGEGAVAQPIIINGRIVSIAIINSGSGYTSPPNVIINGDGYGAIAKATIGTFGEDKGRVLSITVENRGIGYSTGLTTIRCESIGQGASFTANVFEWTQNLETELSGLTDPSRGYVFAGYNTQYGGEYAHLSDPKQLRYVLGDNVFKDPSSGNLRELSAGLRHSPIIGWAFDGNPIYGPYGYIDAADQSSGIKRCVSSYRIKPILEFDTATNPNPVRTDGPLLSDKPAGTYIEDYEYVFQAGDLDQYNGRYCKTPEYPEGTYAYFVSIDASEAGLPVFPYVCGPQLYSRPDEWNYSQDAVQTNIPGDVVRFRDPYEDVDIDIERTPNQDTDTLVTEIGDEFIFEIEDTNRDGVISTEEQNELNYISEEPVLQLFDYYPSVSTRSQVDIEIDTTTKFEDAKISGFVVENPGVSYKVNDKLFFDDTGTGGYGASAKVNAVKGISVSQYTSSLVNDSPLAKITTSGEHDLRVNDEIIVDSIPIIDQTNKTFRVKVVSGVETVDISQQGLGYNDDIPPTYEIVTGTGQDFQLELVQLESGAVNTVNIINSGSQYTPSAPPEVRVSHPQRYKKANYALTLLDESSSIEKIVRIKDIVTADDRTFYVVGEADDLDGDSAGLLAKFNSDGRLLWTRTMAPLQPAAGDKRCVFNRIYLENTSPHSIYVVGETIPNNVNLSYNPDLVVAKYTSGFDAQNNPTAVPVWQREIAGISGSTRRDYITSLTIDDNGQIYVGGTTDTNSPNPDDMWIALLDEQGAIKEKRKICTTSGSEQLTDLKFTSNNNCIFVGVNDPAGTGEIIIGETNYDNVTINVSWSRQFGNTGYRFSNPKVTVDDYGSRYVTATAYQIANTKNTAILYMKFSPSDYKTPSVVKLLAPTGVFEDIQSTGVKFDIFGNVDVGAYVKYAFNDHRAIIFKVSWNTSNILTAASVKQVSGIGFQPTTISNDNSGDTIIAGNKIESNELAILNFESTITGDETYNNTLTAGWSVDPTLDTAKWKYGAQSANTSAAANRLSLDWGADVATNYTVEAWIAIGQAQYNAQSSTPNIFDVAPTTGDNAVVELEGDATSADFGKVRLKLGSNTYLSTTTTNWTTFNNEAFIHVALVKSTPGVGTYVYKVFINGVEQIDVTSTTIDTQLKSILLFGKSSPVVASSIGGWVDNISVSSIAKYSDTFTPAQAVGSNKTVSAFCYKLDREQTKTGTYTLSTVQTGMQIQVAAAVNDFTFNTQVITSGDWELGPAGLQILDYADVVSNNVEGTYSFTSTDQIYETRTATIPTPLGRKLLLSTTVIPKFYIRDAIYQSIDTVKTVTFNQAANFTKGSILQQYSVIGGQDVVSAYGTIVNVRGAQGQVDIGNIIGNFDTTKKLKSTANDVNLINQTFLVETTIPQWFTNFSYTTGDEVYNAGKIYTAGSTGVSGISAPIHTIGTVTDGNINWVYTRDAGSFDIDLANTSYSGGTLNQFASWRPFIATDYSIRIEAVYEGSAFIKGDNIDADAVGLSATFDATGKIITIAGLVGVKKFHLISNLDKDIIPTGALAFTDLVFCVATSKHNFTQNEIIFVEGFTTTEYGGSFFIEEVLDSRRFLYRLRSTAVQDPSFTSSTIASVNIYAKHPQLLFVRKHQYIFDLDDPSNFGYYMSFSKDNQYKLEYPFVNIVREGIPGLTDQTSPKPLVKFIVDEDVTNISYYFDPSRTLPTNSPVGEASFIDVIQTPYKGTFTINQILSDTEFTFPLLVEPEKTNAPLGVTETGVSRASYSTTSLKAIGPIASIKLVNPGGFYQKLPIVTDISSDREIEKIRITSGGTEYINGIYYNVPIAGDGEGGLCNVTVADDGELTGVITAVELTSPGKGYTTASIDIDTIPGILGSLLQGSGGQLDVVIPAEGSGASVFLQGNSIGKIKKLKNNEFGFGYSHDYTLRPEITFPVNLQLFNTAILSEIKVTDPGSGYTSVPRVVIEGGGGTGAEAEAIVKNNRLSEVIIKNPGSGYSSEPSVTLKSEFNYVVNLDLGYLQFNFPHGITTGAAIQLRAEDLGSTVGVLPKPSSAGLVSLSSTTTYYAIAGEANSLEADQLRIALTQVDAESGNFITFLTQGDGRQILLTEVFGGQATAIVQTSRFLKGELVYQGSSLESATATGYVSENEGWQIGPRILKLENYNGTWTVGERVTAQVSRASGLIDNLSIARGTLNIDSMTTTTGQFIDDVGKPSEIVQKIQDSYFYQNFSYVIKSQTPINEWRKSILETNHPVGFNMFGELSLAAGKDISGRKVVSDLVKEVNIFSSTNINQITSFANSQPIYTEFNNTEVLFRQRRLTNSEEILTSIVKKLDNIDSDFNGVKTQFALNVEGESVTATDDQLLILINGVAQSPGTAFTTSGPSVVFSEPPKAPSRIKFRNLTFSQINIIRYTFSSTSGIFPLTGKPVRSLQNEGTATVIDSGVDYIDVIDVEGTFQIGDNVLASSSGFDGVLSAVNGLTSKTIYEQGERITNLQGDFAIIEENNLRDGVVDARLVVSRTSGTSEFETGDFNIKFNDTIYSAASKIAARVTVIAPYTDDSSQQIIDTVDLSPPSTFFGLIFQRVPSITYPNTILDNISETVINPEELYEEGTANNQDFLDFEEVRNQEIRYNYLSGSQFTAGDSIRNKQIYYDNASLVGVDDQRSFDAAVLIRKNARFIAEEAVGLMKAFYPSFTVPSLGGDRDCEDDIVDILNIVAYQLEVDGNSEIWDAASTYVQGNAIYHVDGEVAQTIYAFNKARDLAIQCIRNETISTNTTNLPQYRDPTITAEFAVISNSHGDARDLILANKWFIAYEALHYAKTQNPGYNVSGGDVHCLSDIVDVLEAMVYNLAHGGNNFVYKATKKTLQYGVTSGDRDTIVNAFTKARDIAIEVMRNNTWTKAGSHNWDQVKDLTITADTANPTCQAVASAITTLMNILITNLGSTASPGTVTAFEAAVTETAPSGAYAGYTNSCVNQANAITSYMRIITDTLQDPTGGTPATYQWSITNVPRVLPPYAFVDGETLRCAKHAYRDKSSGGFFVFGDTVRAVTSGATYDVIGSNAGNKWIFSKQISGVLQAGEYITNSKLTYANVSQDKLTFKTDSGSLKFSGSGSYATFPSSNAVLFGDGADAATGDYTMELWIRPASVTGTQRLIDLRESSSDTKLGILMSGQSLRLSIGASDVITVSSAITTINNWYHIAVSRSTSVTKLFVNGQQMGTYTDTNNYNSNSKITVGAGWNNGNPFNGWIDNLVIRKGISQYNSSFTPPIIFNDNINVSFALLGEAPFPMEQSAVYATYVNHIISTATADEVELWRNEITTEGVDLSREQYRICAEVIRKNIDYIAEEAVGRLKYRYPDFVIPGDGGMSGYGSNVCLRDTKSYIIPAIIDDLIAGGNFQTTIVGRAYIEGSGSLQHIGGEQLQSIYTWREVAKLCIDVITLDETSLEGSYSTKVRVPNYFASPASSQIQTDIMTLVDDLLDVIGPTGHRFRDGADLIYFNRKAIADESVYYIENKYQVQVGFSTVNKLTIPNRAKCVRDIRDHILPAIAGDLITGGNFETQAMIDSYLDNETNINYIEDELLAMIDAIEYAKKLAQKAIQGLLIGRNENPAQVAADFSDYYQMLYTDESVYRDDTITIDPKAYNGSDRDLDAANLLQQNAKTIAGEAVDILTKTSFAQSKKFRVPGGKVNCEDDIIDIIESVAHDLRFGGNSETYDAAALYLNTDLALSHVTNQSDETIYAFKLARDMSILTIRNRLGFTPYESEAATGGLGQAIQRPDYYNNATTNGYYDAANEIENNIRFIATTAVGRGMSQYPNLAFSGGYNYQSCVDDVVDLLEALVFNLKHGGNNRMWYSSEFYITVGNAIQHISNQAAEVKYIFEQARDIAIQIMRQQIVAINGVTEGSAIYDSSITIDGTNTTVGNLTPTNVEYFPTTGNLRLTVNGHNLTTSDSIQLAANSLTFTCDFDGNATNHTYPRPLDPSSGALLPVTAFTTNTFTVNVGTTANGTHDVTDAIYEEATGNLFLDIGTNNLNVGRHIKFSQDYAITFTCTKDGNTTNHAYPRPTDYASGKSLEVLEITDSAFTATGATYSPTTGAMTLTVPQHGFSNGDQIRLVNNSLNFTCTMDNNYSVHSYPRASDPASNQYLTISNVATNTFDVNVGSTNTLNYTPSNVAYSPTTGDMVITIGNHSLVPGSHIKIADNSLIFTCLEDNNATEHSYPRTTTTIHQSTAAVYEPSTGMMQLTVPQHGFANGDQIKIATDSLTFTCGQDNNQTNHTYPRATDPAANSWLEISDVTANTFKVQVLLSTGIPSTNTTPHTYVSSATNNITWKKDRAYDVPLEVKAVGQTTITVNVLASGRIPSTNVTTHTFVNAATNAISAGGNYTHTFISAASGGVRFKNGRIKVNVNPAPTNEQYPHTFVSAVSGAVSYGGNHPHNFVSANTNAITFIIGGGGVRCVNEAASITTLMGIPINLFDSSNTSNPTAYLTGITRTLPLEWPLTGERAIRRDVSITYDSAGNGNCTTQSSAINTLWEILINTIDTAAQGNGSHLATVTRTAPVTTNTVYKGGTCYDVTSAAHVLFKTLLHGLGSGTEMYKQSARLLIYNDTYTRLESYEKTLNQYPGYAGDASFAEPLQKAIVYDFITNGNARTLQLVNSWFDADGNFVAYPTLFRTRLLYHARMIKELMDHILKGTAPDPGVNANQPLYSLDGTNPDRELRPTATASHKLHQLFHLILTALQYSQFPTTYLRTQFDAGVAVYDGAINVANNFEPYDRVAYIVLGSNIPELDGTTYYVHPNSTSNKIVLTEYIDGEPIYLSPGLASQLHTLAVEVDPGVDRVPTTYGVRDVPTPIKAGFNLADVLYGGTSGATAQIVRMEDNLADIMYQAKYMTCNTFSAQGGGTGIKIQNGEMVVVQGATSNTGKVLATDNETYIKLIDYNGTFTAGDTIEGVTSGGTCTFADEHDRILVNFRQGEFIATDKFFSTDTGSKATALIVRNNNGALIDNQSGRITYDISTVTGEFKPQDVIYGSVTDQIIEIESFVTLPNFGEYVHGRQITRLTYVQLITDTGVSDTFNVGDVLQVQSGGISIGWTVTVTEIDTNSNYVFVANETGTPEGVTISDIASNSQYQLAKVPVGTLFPSVYTGVAAVTITDTTAYGKIAKITQFGTRAVLHLEGTSGTFQKNSQIIGDNSFKGACSSARSLRGRVRRFFRGFDGIQKAFKLTQGNGTQYFPDPAGHMMIFVNGILQPPGADYAFTAFSDNIQFTEAPAIGSTFHGVYKGKLRQLDDISFDFDSLRNSFNLKLNGVFYSLTLTDGVQSNTILPENNIICQLNGVIQEPGIGFEIVGSRIIFSEVPRAGSTFVAFSYVGSDVDVIAATVVPPIEAGDELIIDGEEETRTVALIESSNSLITFEYGGAVKGRNASALAEIEKGRITNAVLTNSGDGYNTRPQVDVISSTGFGGRIKALVGVARIDVKNAGQGYSLPSIIANTTVADDFLGPTGPALNGGIDIYDPNFIPVTGGTGVIENFITITESPRNITVNQGQTATFQVAAKVTISNVVAYQITVADKSVTHPYYGQGSGKGYNFTGGQFNSNTEAPTLVFVRGATYQFNQNDVTNSTHALYFSEDATAYGGNSRYETGVVYRLNGNQVADYATYVAGFNAATTRSVSITVAADAPATLNYVCGNHQYMGSAINVNNGTLSYQWQKKDYGTSSWNNITGAISSTYTTAATTQADTNDEYRVGITSNGAIPVLSTAAVLTVNIGATTLSSFTPTQIFDDD